MCADDHTFICVSGTKREFQISMTAIDFLTFDMDTQLYSSKSIEVYQTGISLLRAPPMYAGHLPHIPGTSPVACLPALAAQCGESAAPTTVPLRTCHGASADNPRCPWGTTQRWPNLGGTTYKFGRTNTVPGIGGLAGHHSMHRPLPAVSDPTLSCPQHDIKPYWNTLVKSSLR